MVETVEHPKHAHHVAVGAQHGNGKELFDFELRDGFEIRAGELGDVVAPEDLFRDQRLGSDTLGESQIDPARGAFFGAEPDPEGAVFEEPDKAASESEKIGSAHNESFQKFIQVSNGAELGGNLQQLVQFVRLAAGGRIEFGIGHGHGAKSGDCRNQGSLVHRKDAVLARIDEDCSLRSRCAEGCCQKHARGDQVPQ